MALWTMKHDGTRVLVVSTHRAYAAAMTEDNSLTGEESERLKAALAGWDTLSTTAQGTSLSAGRNLWRPTGPTSRSP